MSELEQEANHGAAEYLMPANLVQRAIAIVKVLPFAPRDLAGYLARLFRASKRTMEIRLEEIARVQ